MTEPSTSSNQDQHVHVATVLNDVGLSGGATVPMSTDGPTFDFGTGA